MGRAARARSPLLVLALAAALATGCGQLGSSAPSQPSAAGRCDDGSGVRFSAGTRAQTVAAVSHRQRLLQLAVDDRWVVWSEDAGRAGGVVCQYNFASDQVTALAGGPLSAQGIASTAAGVYFVYPGGGAQALMRVDHEGLHVREVAAGVAAPISGRGQFVAYGSRAGADLEVTVLDTRRRGTRAVALRHRFARCSATAGCSTLVSVQMLPDAVAWMTTPATGSSTISVQPLGGKQVDVTAAADPRVGLLPSDGPMVFAGSAGGWFSWTPGSAIAQLDLPSGTRPVGASGGRLLLVTRTGADEALDAKPALGSRLDATASLTGPGQAGRFAGVAAGPSQICDLVNVYGSPQPSGAARPVVAHVRCAPSTVGP